MLSDQFLKFLTRILNHVSIKYFKNQEVFQNYVLNLEIELEEIIFVQSHIWEK